MTAMTAILGPGAVNDSFLDSAWIHAYDMALDFHAVATSLPQHGASVLREQLDSASLDVVLQLAAASGPPIDPGSQGRYEIAYRSAIESATVLEELKARGLVENGRALRVHAKLDRLVELLQTLSQRN